MIDNIYELIESNGNYKYMIIFTNLDEPDKTITVAKRKNLKLSENGFTCCWDIAENRTVDKIVLYIREQGINKIYMGDYLKKEKIPEDRERYKIFFENLKEMGVTKNNWNKFMNSKARNPVRYINIYI